MGRGQRCMQHKVRARLTELAAVSGADFSSSSCCFQFDLMDSTGFSLGAVTRASREPKRIRIWNKSRSMLLALTECKCSLTSSAQEEQIGRRDSLMLVKTPCSRESEPTSVVQNLGCQVQIGL